VVFTSDHGEGLGDHPELGHSVSVWEEQLAVPLLARLPGGFRGGERVEETTTLTALVPSLLDWLGIEPPAHLEDAPGLDAAAGRDVLADYRSYFSETGRPTNVRMAASHPELAQRVTHAHVLYCGSHKLVVRPGERFSLFDLATDPGEQEDLAPAAPPELESCLGSYREALERRSFTPFDEMPSEEERTRSAESVDAETLRALGYLN